MHETSTLQLCVIVKLPTTHDMDMCPWKVIKVECCDPLKGFSVGFADTLIKPWLDPVCHSRDLPLRLKGAVHISSLLSYHQITEISEICSDSV